MIKLLRLIIQPFGWVAFLLAILVRIVFGKFEPNGHACPMHGDKDEFSRNTKGIAQLLRTATQLASWSFYGDFDQTLCSQVFTRQDTWFGYYMNKTLNWMFSQYHTEAANAFYRARKDKQCQQN